MGVEVIHIEQATEAESETHNLPAIKGRKGNEQRECQAGKSIRDNIMKSVARAVNER